MMLNRAIGLLVGLVLIATACDRQPPMSPDAAGVDMPAFSAGHGGPQGPHDYQLLIIGTGDKSADMDNNDGRRIFVPLWGKVKINLVEGPFEVLDANGTDSDGATFQLPAPGLDAYIVGDPGDADVWSEYSVFVRPLGTPGGWSTITTCADVLDSTFGGLLSGSDIKILNNAGDLGGLCSLEQVGQDITMRNKGQSRFENVTAALTTIVFDVEIDFEGDGVVDETVQVRVPIFDDSLENEYWEYDNHGLRVLQVRFYDCSTNVETGETTC